MTSDAEAQVRQVLRSYLDAVALVEPLQTRLWRRSHLTLSQARALRLLRRKGPLGLAELGQLLGHSPPTLSRLIDRLEDRGLVIRRRDSSDRRRVTVELAEAGERLAADQPVLAAVPIRRAVEAMTADQRCRLAQALRDLVESVRQLMVEEEQRSESVSVGERM